MAPPPPPLVTPSPHRFVVKKERNVRRTPLAPDQASRPPSSQFKAKPRFTFSSTPRPTPTQDPPRATPSASRFTTPASRPFLRDAINDSSDEILEESIEVEEDDIEFQFGLAKEDNDYKIEEPSPKRRRLSSSPDPDLLGSIEVDADVKPSIEEPDEDLLSSSLPIISSPPPAPRQRLTTTTSRFLLSTPAPPAATQPTAPQSTFLKPPRFRPPDPAEAQKHADPLPDQFSPHRKGQKYAPGGLAAEVRDWLVNVESAIPSAPQKSKEDVWLVQVLADEVSGGARAGMTLVRGRQVHDMGSGGMADTVAVVKVILAGEGAGTGLQKGSPVEVGKIVGIKDPLWEVVIEGEKWGVGVDWKVLSG